MLTLRFLSSALALSAFPCSAVPASPLTDYRVDIDQRTEAAYDLPDGYVITGLGFGQRYPDDITTLRVKIQPVGEDGTLGQGVVVRAGVEPEWDLVADLDLPKGWVAVGYGASPETLAIWAAPLRPDGSLGEPKEFRTGPKPEGALDVSFVAPPGRALTGLGLHRSGDNLKGMRARTAQVFRGVSAAPSTEQQPGGLRLANFRTDADERTEAVWGLPDGWVVTGLGARAAGQDVDAVLIRGNYLDAAGRFGDDVIIRSGRNASANMEAEMMLPPGWVVVGAAASGQPEGDIRCLIVYGSPILPNGKLGIVRVFRAGFEPDSRDRQREVMIEGNRAMTAFGLRMAGHSIEGVMVRSAELVGVPEAAK